MATRSTLPGSGGTGDTTGDVWNTTAINKLPGGANGWHSQAGGVDISSPAADVDTVTITCMTSRFYLIEVTGYVTSTVVGDVIRMSITDASDNILKSQEMPISKASTSTPFFLRVIEHAPSAGSQLYKIRGGRITGSGTVTCGATLMTTIDFGPDF